jgi:hypothetical protein
MKKQILILLMVLVAIGFTTTVYGQLVPRPITCLSADALHPIAGTPYTYTISVPTPTGAKTILWRVTQDQTFISNKALVALPEIPGTSDYLAAADADYNTFNNVSPGNLDMVLTWKSFTYDPLNPVFVIVHVANDDGTCNINNMKVYRIEPVNAFTLDIANTDPLGSTQAGYGTNPLLRCLSNVLTATYNSAGAGSVDYDFGLDTIYYEVVAANWSGQWKPSAQVAGLNAEETIISVDWSYIFVPAPGAWPAHPMTLAGGIYVSNDNVEPQGSPQPPSVGAAGQSIFIRMIIDHTVPPSNYEGLTDETFTLAVDGELYSYNGTNWIATGVNDVHYDNGPNNPPCPTPVEDGFTNDIAQQTLKARPDVQAVTPTPFLPVTP